MTQSHRSFLVSLAAILAAACMDASRPAAPTPDRAATDAAMDRGGRRDPKRFVAIGTSISMGWQSDGVYYGSQLVSWPELLATSTGNPISLPLIQKPGCISPIVAPLGAGKRMSGESISGSTVCAPNVNGVVLPTRNVAISTAIAADALLRTPEAPGSAPWYARVLRPGQTQITAAMSQNPTLLSVELGGNELLKGTSGLVLEGVTIVPFPAFVAPYNAILDIVSASGVKAALAGLPIRLETFPALRPAPEIWNNRAEFAALNVIVSPDCDGSPNYVNVSVKSLNLVFAASMGPTQTYSCADVPFTVDYVLSPAEMAHINGLLDLMNAHIRAEATARGFALWSIGAVYDRTDVGRGPYSIVKQLTSPLPYGPLVSLDGVHPNALGHAVLAFAAGRAIVQKYGGAAFALAPAPEPEVSALTTAPATAAQIKQARGFAQANRGKVVSPCAISYGCSLNAP